MDEEVIDSFLKDRHYGQSYTVAKGTEPVSGREGYVEYKFNTELSQDQDERGWHSRFPYIREC